MDATATEYDCKTCDNLQVVETGSVTSPREVSCPDCLTHAVAEHDVSCRCALCDAYEAAKRVTAAAPLSRYDAYERYWGEREHYVDRDDKTGGV